MRKSHPQQGFRWAFGAVGRVGSVGVLLAAGMGWLMTRFGNAIRDHRHEIRQIRRRGLHAGLAWR